MKEDLLGLNHLLSFAATVHTVRPRSSALSSGHRKMAPPQSSSANPKCFRYHAARASWSPVLLKKTPPMPVIFAMTLPRCRCVDETDDDPHTEPLQEVRDGHPRSAVFGSILIAQDSSLWTPLREPLGWNARPNGDCPDRKSTRLNSSH